MRSVYLSLGKCEELFQRIAGGGGDLLAYSRLADATVSRLSHGLRRRQPRLTPCEIDEISETAVIKTFLKLGNFDCFLQSYSYARRVASSLFREKEQRRHSRRVLHEVDMNRVSDPGSSKAERHQDLKELVEELARKLDHQDLRLLLHFARSTLLGPESPSDAAADLGICIRTLRSRWQEAQARIALLARQLGWR